MGDKLNNFYFNSFYMLLPSLKYLFTSSLELLNCLLIGGSRIYEFSLDEGIYIPPPSIMYKIKYKYANKQLFNLLAVRACC